MDYPLVSVLLPIGRDSIFLDSAIDSILTQTFENFELILLANNCSDHLFQKLLKIKDQRIKVIRNQVPGLPFNLTFGLNIARGKYIARMDDDDISLPNRLETQISFLENNPDVSVLGCTYECIDENGIRLQKQPKIPISISDFDNLSYYECGIAHPSIMAKKDVLLQAGGYSFGEYGEDYDLWLRLKRCGVKFSNTTELLFLYRIHKLQSSGVANASRNRAYVCSLKVREFMLTKDSRYLDAFFQDLFGEKSWKYKASRLLLWVLRLRSKVLSKTT